MRKQNDQSIGDALKELLAENHITAKVREVQLQNGWEALMGKTIARETDEVLIKNKKLILKIKSAPLRHELKFHIPQMIGIVNTHFGDTVVESIVLL